MNRTAATEIQQRCRTTTEWDGKRKRLQSGCRRLQRHGNNGREGESDGEYKTTWSPEQHPARRQWWEMGDQKARKERKNKEQKSTQTEKNNSPQPTNAARVQLPHRLTARPLAKRHHFSVTSCWLTPPHPSVLTRRFESRGIHLWTSTLLSIGSDQVTS